MKAIEVQDLTRDYDGLRAVDHIEFSVESGQIFGFLGPNGAGKTTTIHLLLGLLEPTDGRATVLGFDTMTEGDEVRARVGALLEHAGVYEQLSAEDNLEFYGRVYRMPSRERQTRIKELLTQMDLWERRGDRAGEWSKGMKQKLALSRAMLHRPQLVFLDEPTAGLDVVSANAVRESLAALAEREGVTVFLTTHNMTEAERLCQQVAVIREGRLVAIGSPDELRARSGGPQLTVVGRGFNEDLIRSLRERPEVAEVALENGHLCIDLRTETDTAPLVSLAVSQGAQVQEVRRGKASLEEVFLTLMEEEE
jgi:ABC-2 type transport system ATP-binding protein